MKIVPISKFIILLLFTLFLFGSKIFGQANLTSNQESNPHRGIYLDKLFYIDPISWNIGSPYHNLNPQFSILGTDLNRDGIFEKEDEFLEYCRDNHITYIVLYSLHKILGTHIELWNENTGRMEDIEMHLCRFMNKARNEYCIDQIAASADNTGRYSEILEVEDPLQVRSTPPISIPLSEKMSDGFDSLLLVMEDSTIAPGDSAFHGNELLKSIYRSVHLEDCEECETFFNYIFLEYEFWHNSPDDYVNTSHGFPTPDPSCVIENCDGHFYRANSSQCTSGLYPDWITAKYGGHFQPVVRAMRSMVDTYNSQHGFTNTDVEFMRTDAYVDPSPFPVASVTPSRPNMTNYAFFMDGGTNIDLKPGAEIPCNPRVTDFPRLLDRITPYHYIQFDPVTQAPPLLPIQWDFLNGDLNDYNATGEVSTPTTDLHPLFSAEKISNNGWTDFWGPWFDLSKCNNIFEAERLYYSIYAGWSGTHGNYGLTAKENSMQRGGVLWFTQSQMVAPLSDPKIFFGDVESCYSGLTTDITFHYIGPPEANLLCTLTVENPVNGFSSVQFFQTKNYFWDILPFAAPDIVVTGVPILNDDQHPYLVTMNIEYPGQSFCSYEYSEEIIVSSLPTIQAWGPLEFCEGGNVTLHANAVAPTTVQWSRNGTPIPAPSGQLIDLPVTESGTYNCIISGCSLPSNDLQVNFLPNPYVDVISLCDGSHTLFAGPILNPSITSNGPGGVTYLWGTGETTDRIQTTINGTYSLIVTSTNGCTRAVSGISSSSSSAPNLFESHTQPTTACTADGSITVWGIGSIPHVALSDGSNTYYTGQINPLNSNQYLFTNLSTGEYTIYVAPSGGACSGVLNVTLGQPSNFTVTSQLNDVSCHGGINGSIEITGISGGSGNYTIEIPALARTYSFITGTTTLIDINALAAGNYFIKITDSNCEWMIVDFPIDEPSPIVLDMSSDDVSGCHDDTNGSVSVSVLSGGQSPYSVLWDDANSSTTSAVINLGFGTYNVIVTDDNGCTVSGFTQVSAPDQLLITEHHPFLSTTVCGCDASLTYCLFGGTGDLTVTPSSWSVMNNMATLDGLCAGDIATITVTDEENCFIQRTETISAGPSALVADIQNNTACNATGELCATHTGGTAPYSYLWSNTETTSCITGLPNGTYSVTITDANGCTSSYSTTVTISTAMTISFNLIKPDCGSSNGSACATILGGINPVITWPDGTHNSCSGNNIASGSYTIVVTDANGCTATAPLSIPSNPAITVTLGALQHACNSTSSGAICVGATGGTPGFTYQWSTSSSAQCISGLSGSATYTVTVTDSRGCTNTRSFTINSSPPIVISLQSSTPACIGATGSACVTTSGGSGTITYQWSNGQTGNCNINVNPGTYTVTAKDANNCTSTLSVLIKGGSPSPFVQSITHACNGSTTGEACVSQTGGTGPFSYLWSNSLVGPCQTLSIGNYTVTVTDANGCTGTVAVVIKSSTSINVTITGTNTCAIHDGSATSSVSGGVGPYQYHWSNGKTTSSVTNLGVGNYFVIVTDANGCTGTDDVDIINPLHPIPSISGPVSNCEGSETPNYYSIQNYNSTFDGDYQWSAELEDGTPVSINNPNGNNEVAEILWPANTGGIITVNFTPENCSKTFIFYVQSCCLSGRRVYYDGQNQDILSPGEFVTMNGLTFNGIFHITRDFSFIGCHDLYFGPGAKILVESGVTLTIDACLLTTGTECCKMWKGIELQPDARIVFSKSQIEQAEYAITVRDKCSYKITDSHFRNNYIGLNVNSGGYNMSLGPQADIENTEFYSDNFSSCDANGPFVEKYLGQQTDPDTRPLAGIFTENVALIRIGNNSTTVGNISFHELSNGIVTKGGSTYIDNSQFKNINTVMSYNPMFTTIKNGSCISNNAGSINVTGLGPQSGTPNTFESSDYGISTYYSDAIVSECKSEEDVYTGMYIRYSRNVDVFHNTWKAMFIGINTFNNPNSTIHIHQNEFYMTVNPYPYFPVQGCILLDEFNALNNIIIDEHNEFYLNTGIYGIYCTSHSAVIKENYIEMNNTPNRFGISEVTGGKNFIQCNTILSTMGMPNNHTGIGASMCPNSEIGCNYLDDQNTGIKFNNACDNTNLLANELHDHNIGLLIAFNGKMGIQSNKGNNWNGSYNTAGAFLTSPTTSQAALNQIQWDGVTPSHVTSNNFSSWFSNNSLTDALCKDYTCEPIRPQNFINPEDLLVAASNSIGTEYIDQSNYLFDKFLFKKLYSDSTLLSNPSLLTFYNQKYNSNIGLFNDIEVKTAEAFKWTDVHQQILATNADLINSKSDSIILIDSLIKSNPSNSFLPILFLQLNTDLKNLHLSNENITNVQKQMQEIKVDLEKIKNDAVITSRIYEENEKAVNDIYMNTIAKENYSINSTQASTLENIIYQCPFDGGPAVYFARSLYRLVNETIFYEDDSICISLGVHPKLRAEEEAPEFGAYPNPTSNNITITYEIPKDSHANFRMYDLIGNLVFSRRLDSKNNSVQYNFENLKPGIYRCGITNETEKFWQGKIAIIR